MSTPNLKYVGKLSGKRVLVVGATSGIGLCIAEAAVEHGARVILSSSNPTKLDKAAARLQPTYPGLLQTNPLTTHACDLSDSENLERNLTDLLKAASQSGKLNHIAWTAGDALRLPPLEDFTIDSFNRAGLVRCAAPLLMAKILPTYMDLSPENSFTFTGGSNTQKPMRGWAVMVSWGAAIEGAMRGMAVDLQPLRVNIVSPGAVHTELFSGLPKENLDGMLDSFRKASTTGTVGKPEDVAEAYIYVMKDQFTTGSIIESNGGRLLV
ncbi:NAD(P)-binding protein [Aspergillus steynii IBT 23096]|uniref:NAD(P)-binding protein n=1 Tax=Aspergillus steynii IBT 23096 TaxID=1392250 RepID=A0A2I2FWN9_9EURO|nr:NAD(P)-binding protein [Aspergillus steynii IBT 23096]PLB45027.1 NAD(P)-binding protein [Aspergillus steynii IBT 23096]